MKAVIYLLSLSALILPGIAVNASLEQEIQEVDATVAVPLGKYPWHVFIYDSQKYLGSGSIISKSWVLTAAELCKVPKTFSLEFGTNRQYDVEAIKRVSSDLQVHSAVCLIKLSEPLEFSENISSIKLPTQERTNEYYVDQNVHIAGVNGLKSQFSSPRKMSWGQVTIVPLRKCNIYFRNFSEESSLCVEGNEHIPYDIFCRTEYGTPLTIKEDDDKWIQIGFKVRVGHSRCAEDSYSLYEFIGPYLDFINETIKEN